MAEREITTVFRADISQFSASTQQLNKYVSTVNSEFKLATASMGKWNDNTDGLTAKLTQLNKVLDAEEKKLKMLEDQYAELVRQGKENTKEAQDLAIAINNQGAKVKETKKNIDHYSKSLKELEDAGVNTKQELDDLNKELEEQKQAAKELGGNVLKGVGTGILGIGAACVGAFAAMNSIVEETKELRTQMGMLKTSFTEAGLSTKDAEKTFNDLYAVLGDNGKATEASLHLAQIAKDEKELAEYTNILTGVYATFGDSLPVEGLAEAMNHTAKLGSVQGVLADALEWAGINVDDFNAHLETLNTEEERAAYINETLNGIYGETAEKYKETNKDLIAANEAQNAYNQTMAEVGEKVQPIITKFKLTMAEALGWIIDNKDIVIAGVAGIGTAFAAWKVTSIVTNAVKAVKALSAATKGQTIAQTALNLVMKANPIGIVITLIAGLVAAFVVLWNKCEGFRNFFIKMWDGIKKAGGAAVDWIRSAFESTMNVVKGIINGIINLINGAIGAINKIKVDIPDWVPKYGGSSFGLNIPKIPTLATGGVVDQPTLAMIGEAGKEAVMPLENNTGWIDKLADKLSGKMGTSNVSYVINNKFEKMETSRLALHKANLETKRLLGGAR